MRGRHTAARTSQNQPKLAAKLQQEEAPRRSPTEGRRIPALPALTAACSPTEVASYMLRHIRRVPLIESSGQLNPTAGLAVVAVCACIALYRRVLALEKRLHRVGKPDMIILMRHGESQGNVDQEAYATIGDPNVELTEQGRAQAHAAGDRLANLIQDRRLAAYVSPYKRSARPEVAPCTDGSCTAARLLTSLALRFSSQRARPPPSCCGDCGLHNARCIGRRRGRTHAFESGNSAGRFSVRRWIVMTSTTTLASFGARLRVRAAPTSTIVSRSSWTHYGASLAARRSLMAARYSSSRTASPCASLSCAGCAGAWRIGRALTIQTTAQ